MKYRKYLIICINFIIATWLYDTIFYPEFDTDFFGLFLGFGFGFWFIYNVYAFLIYKYYFVNTPSKPILEISFVLLLLLPFFMVWYFTT